MYEYSFLVTRVIDGDTVEGVADLGFGVSKKMKVRLYDVDTPEIFRPKSKEEKELGLKAREFVKEKVLNKKVLLKTIKDNKGKFGRYLGIIHPTSLRTDPNYKPLHEQLKENKLTKSDVI